MHLLLNPKFLNSLGLTFDIFGAWFVAIEVVHKFKGGKYYKDPSLYAADMPPCDSDEYKKWEFFKYKYMWLGLALLTIGFIMQICSNWL